MGRQKPTATAEFVLFLAASALSVAGAVETPNSISTISGSPSGA
jgi:hypothetical protein